MAFGPDSPIGINDPAMPYIHLCSQTKMDHATKIFISLDMCFGYLCPALCAYDFVFCFCVTLCLWAFPPPVFILCYLAALNTTSATQTVHLLLSQGLPQLSIFLYVETLDVSYPQIVNDLQHCCPKKVATKIRIPISFEGL